MAIMVTLVSTQHEWYNPEFVSLSVSFMVKMATMFRGCCGQQTFMVIKKYNSYFTDVNAVSFRAVDRQHGAIHAAPVLIADVSSEQTAQCFHGFCPVLSHHGW